MDPEKTLGKLRSLMLGLPFEIDELGLVSLDRASEIHEHFTALDEWLTKGGFKPKEWA